MLIAAFILVISIAAMMQFAVFAWRASLLRTVSERFANESDATLQPHPDLLTSSSFQEVVTVYDELCPELEAGPTPNLHAVSFYYGLMSFVNRVGGLFIPAEGFSWTHREMALCTQYATVRLSQRLERNITVVSQARSF
jgi:hypothetical protein